MAGHLRTREGEAAAGGFAADAGVGVAGEPWVRSAGAAWEGFRRSEAFWPWVLALVLALLRLWLCMQTPVLATMYRIHDEGLFINEAWSILEGRWLGDNITLAMVKNPGFAVFLAASSLTGLSYQFWIGVVGVVAAALSAFALAPAVRSPWLRLGVFAWTLFGPVLFCLHAFLYVYRNILVAELTVIVVASYLALWLRRDRFAARWLIPAAIALALFWITNESVVWLVPFVLVASVVIAVCAWRGARLKTLWLLAPPAACACAWLCVSLLNLACFGVFANNTRFEGNQGKVAADLLAIGGIDELEPYEPGDEWVTADELDAAIAASPTLATIADEARFSYGEWAKAGGGIVPGDIYSWALIDALGQAEPDSTAAEREAFWGRVHEELEGAFASGELEREEGLRLAASTPAVPGSAVGEWVANGLRALLSVFDGSILGESATVDLEEFPFEELAGTPAMQDVAQLIVNGPMIHYSEAEGQGPIARAGRLALKVDRAMMALWRLALPVASIVGLVALVYLVVRAIGGSRRAREALLPVAGILLTMLALSLAVSWFSEWLGAQGLFDYLVPSLALGNLLLAWLYAVALAELTDAE